MKLSISQFAEKCNVGVETIRFYHREGLLPIPATQGAMRLYGETEYQSFVFIRNAKACGLTLQAIKQLISLDRKSSGSCDVVKSLVSKQLEELTKKLEELHRITGNMKCMTESCDSCTGQEGCEMLSRLDATV